MTTANNHRMPSASPSSGRGSYFQYVAGFLLSAVLTLTAFYIVNRQVDSPGLFLSQRQILLGLAGLAILQLGVQLVAFLHLGRGSSARWNLLVFGFMLTVVIILVAGSLWIMYSLDYGLTPEQAGQYLKEQESGGL